VICAAAYSTAAMSEGSLVGIVDLVCILHKQELTTSDSSMLSSGATTLLRPVGGTAGAYAIAVGRLGSAPASTSSSLTLHGVRVAEKMVHGHRWDLAALPGIPIIQEFDSTPKGVHHSLLRQRVKLSHLLDRLRRPDRMIMSSSTSSCTGGICIVRLSAGAAASVLAVLVSGCAVAAALGCMSAVPGCIAPHKRSTRAALLPLLGSPRCASSPSKSACIAKCSLPLLRCEVRVSVHASSTYMTFTSAKAMHRHEVLQ
jgi:hypothetical protein